MTERQFTMKKLTKAAAAFVLGVIVILSPVALDAGAAHADPHGCC